MSVLFAAEAGVAEGWTLAAGVSAAAAGVVTGAEGEADAGAREGPVPACAELPFPPQPLASRRQTTVVTRKRGR
ncbi:hypothetical protein MKZ24_22100 [Paenibacillus sp. FSL R7-0297]|uniref:hypothetical protein n=1 Tax=unclassified Paenibacillus TaxID=185978 RepID=UPI001E43E265|nr:hypothetical protein [Paenibacillus sp. FSL R5-0912]